MPLLGSIKLTWEAVTYNTKENSWHQQLDQEVEQEKLSITSSPGSIDHILDGL